MSRAWAYTPMDERFWRHVDKSAPNGCWEWVGNVDRGGYGIICRPRRQGTTTAHRYSAALHFGMFDRRLFVCHHCDNRRCVNPEHLYLGDQLTNTQDMLDRGRAAFQRQTHCKNGHPFDETNTRIDSKGWRACRQCKLLGQRRYMERRAAS